MIDPQFLWIVCRFSQYVSLMLLWGGFGYLAVVLPSPLSITISDKLSWMSTAAIVLDVFSVMTSLPAQVALVGTGWKDAVDPGVISPFFMATSAGRAWLLQAAGGCLLLLARHLIRESAGTLAVIAGLLLAGLAFTGHAAIHEGLAGAGDRLIDILHVLAAGAWVGALVPFLCVMNRATIITQRHLAVIGLKRFSTLGHIAVLVVFLSGVANTVVVVGLPTNWHSPYQLKLLLKIGVVLSMAAIALVNRYVLVPRLQKREAWALGAIKVGAGVEIGLSLLALALVASFGTEDPA